MAAGGEEAGVGGPVTGRRWGWEGVALRGGERCRQWKVAVFEVWGRAGHGVDIDYGSGSRRGAFEGGAFGAAPSVAEDAMLAQLGGSGGISCSRSIGGEAKKGHASGEGTVCDARLTGGLSGGGSEPALGRGAVRVGVGGRILGGMTKPGVPKRHLPTSPFAAPVTSEPERFAVGDQVTHDVYGLGRVVGVEDGTAALVDFGASRMRILSPYTKMTKL